MPRPHKNTVQSIADRQIVASTGLVSQDQEAEACDWGVHPNSSKPLTTDTAPTLLSSSEWQFLFSFVNERLFDGRLPDCMITQTRQSGVLGHFYPNRYVREDGTRCHEIAINPKYWVSLGDQEGHQTLVHETCHLARYEFGELNRKGGRGTDGYHDLVWVKIMESVGLCPSHDGKPGGRKTGYQMMDYVIESGPFDLAFRELALTDFKISWLDADTPSSTSFGFGFPPNASGDRRPDNGSSGTKPKRLKFTCPRCQQNAWAKPSAKLTCTPCDVPMRDADTSTRTSRSPLPVKVKGTARD